MAEGIARLYTTESNYITLPEDEGFVRLRLRGNELGEHNGADVYIVLNYKINFRTGVIAFWCGHEERPRNLDGTLFFFTIKGYLPLDGDDTPRGSGLRFNLYSAILDTETMSKRISEILRDPSPTDSPVWSPVWDYFCLSFYNNITQVLDNNILNAIKEIIVVRDRSGNIYGGRKTRKRKRRRVKSAKRRRYGRRSLRRKKNKTRTKKKSILKKRRKKKKTRRKGRY